MSREAAIEAGIRAVEVWERGSAVKGLSAQDRTRAKVALIIDAAAPHLKAEVLREAAEAEARAVAMMHRTVRWEACNGIVKRLFARADHIERGETP